MPTTSQPQFPGETDGRGRWVRQQSAFRDRVTAGGPPDHRAEPGRYHLYVSLACPWAHRTIIFRKLKGLEEVIGMTVVDPVRDERGWAFTDRDGCGPDPVNGFRFLAEAYRATDPDFDGRVTVPVLWDRRRGRIVNNESAEIIRMLNSAWDEWGDGSVDLYPADLREAIDAINEEVYANVNDGVYRCGFAASQDSYDEAFGDLFATMDRLEQRLGRQRCLAGDRVTEADWRLFTTMARFDAVYYVHFKCNRHRLVDFPRLWAHVRRLYHWPGVAGTVDFDHIKTHYYVTHRRLNPSGIVPRGPEIDWSAVAPGTV